MRNSGQEVDQLFFEICATFNEVDATINSLDKILINQDIIFYDSLRLISIQARPEINEDFSIDFVTFNEYLKFHNKLLKKTDLILNYFSTHPTKKTDSLETLFIELSFYKIQTRELRDEYNDKARNHNAYIKKFPKNFYSSFFHFQSKPYFK